MGRELRRKQAKKEGKSLQREEIVEKNQIRRLIIITIVLLMVFGIIYLMSALFITKELDWFSNGDTNTGDENSGSEIQNSILASQIFKQQEEEYYIYFYDFDDTSDDLTMTTLVDEKITDEKVYKVDTGSALNSNYVSEDSNKKAKTLEELKVKSQTLIKIKADKIVEYYEGNEITKKLG